MVDTPSTFLPPLCMTIQPPRHRHASRALSPRMLVVVPRSSNSEILYLEACTCTFGARRNLIRSFVRGALTQTHRSHVEALPPDSVPQRARLSPGPTPLAPAHTLAGSTENSSTFPGQFPRPHTPAKYISSKHTVCVISCRNVPSSPHGWVGPGSPSHPAGSPTCTTTAILSWRSAVSQAVVACHGPASQL